MSPEARLSFPCFGGEVAVHLSTRDRDSGVNRDLQRSRERLLIVHRELSRFIPSSELSRLNRAPQRTVRASRLMRMFVRAALFAARRSRGLVDPTLVGALEQAGYESSLDVGEALPLQDALAAIGDLRRPACADPSPGWRSLEVDDRAGTVSRAPGVRLDSGGIAKGLAADMIAGALRQHPAYAVDCCGDVRIGGLSGVPRKVIVDDPFGGRALHEFEVDDGAAATSGIGRRAWLDPDGRPAHHLLDPATGEPAFTGIVQATALAPTAQLAEVLAKTALLRGPEGAAGELPYGGALVFDNGSFQVVPGSRSMAFTDPRSPGAGVAA